jgi:hypothetical protein
MVVLVRHDRGCPFGQKNKPHDDAAKRVYDTYHLHRSADIYGAVGKWFAAALADGTTDGQIYDSKKEAIRHQHHNEQYYTFIQITQAYMTVCSAQVMLDVARRLYDAGLRMTDPDDYLGGKEPIKRVAIEDQMAFARHGIVTNIEYPKELENARCNSN